MLYSVTSDWDTGNGTQRGFSSDISIKNSSSSTINGWTLSFSFSGNQQLTSTWNASYTQSGQSVSLKGLGWNGSVAPGGTATFGFNAQYSGTNANPTVFFVNGTRCS